MKYTTKHQAIKNEILRQFKADPELAEKVFAAIENTKKIFAEQEKKKK